MRVIGSLLFLVAAPFLCGCGNQPGPSTTSQDLAGIETRSEYLTLWHGTDPSLIRLEAAAILGDDRAARIVTTPSQFEIEVEAADQDREVRTAVRRTASHPDSPTVFELFWEELDGSLQSLAREERPAEPDAVSESWLAIRADVPRSAGKLIFVARDPRPNAASEAPMSVAWATPRLALSGQGSAATAKQPDVLLVTIDTLRYDALDHAPGLQAILQQGKQWSRAMSPSNWTLPSYASLFTGLDAPDHQAGRGPFTVEASGEPEDRQLSGVDPALPMLAEHFYAAGYATGMVHQNPMMETWTGFNRGFERYVRASDRNEDARKIAESWWESNEDRPRFFVLHLMAPHLPYRVGPDPDPLEALPVARFFGEDHSPEERAEFFDLPEPDRELVRSRYFAEVSQLDAELSLWLNKLIQDPARQDGSLVLAFHSDHGEELWDDGSFEHGHSFTDSVVHVPLGVVSPGRLSAEVIHGIVPAHGLAAELMDLASIEHQFEHRLTPGTGETVSRMPLYRAEHSGRQWTPQPLDKRFPFRPELGSGGDGAWITEEKRQMLIELGYLAERERRPSSPRD